MDAHRTNTRIQLASGKALVNASIVPVSGVIGHDGRIPKAIVTGKACWVRLSCDSGRQTNSISHTDTDGSSTTVEEQFPDEINFLFTLVPLPHLLEHTHLIQPSEQLPQCNEAVAVFVQPRERPLQRGPP